MALGMDGTKVNIYRFESKVVGTRDTDTDIREIHSSYTRQYHSNL